MVLTERNNELLEEEIEEHHLKYDPEKINIVTREPTIEQLLRRIDEQAFDLAPDFQRQANIWKDDVKSRLIESILIRIPLPAFYVDATNEDKWLVVDGLQRLSALKHFISDTGKNRLKLIGLEYLTELEGKTYEELERRYQRRLEETQVTVYLIDKGTPTEVKYNIFKRINTGGERLLPQEIRHALNPGQATKFIAKLADLEEFKRVVPLSESKIKRMDDREFTLGFLAFKITSYQEYENGNRDTFLSDALAKANNLSQDEIEKIKRDFQQSMAVAFKVFGDNAFRKLSKNNPRKYPLNKALFEAWSVSFSNLNLNELEIIEKRRHELITIFTNYLDKDQKFLKSVSQAANKVDYRFRTIEKILKEVIS
ncbi:MAG: DUF262 domain-containing protein [Cyanobacteria bacterium P01_A01_bin.40]